MGAAASAYVDATIVRAIKEAAEEESELVAGHVDATIVRAIKEAAEEESKLVAGHVDATIARAIREAAEETELARQEMQSSLLLRTESGADVASVVGPRMRKSIAIRNADVEKLSRACFERIDLNKNGFVCMTELEHFLSAEAKIAMASFDRNEDDRVVLHEFSVFFAFIEEDLGVEGALDALRKTEALIDAKLNSADTNGDGRISAHQAAALARKLEGGSSRGVCDAVDDEADKNALTQLLARLDLSDLTPQMQDAGMDIEAVRLMQAHEWGQIGVSPAKGAQIRAAAASVT